MERVENKVSAEYQAWVNQIYGREDKEYQALKEGASFFAETVKDLPQSYCKKFQEYSDSSLDFRSIYPFPDDFESKELRYIEMLPEYLRFRSCLDIAVFAVRRDRDGNVTSGCLAISSREKIFRGMLFSISNELSSSPLIYYPYGIDEKSAEEMKKLTKAEMLLVVNALARVYVEKVNASSQTA